MFICGFAIFMVVFGCTVQCPPGAVAGGGTHPEQLQAMGHIRSSRIRFAKAVVQSLVVETQADGSLCAICLLSMHEGACALKCAHAYHTECIVRWLKTAPTCPVCRNCVEPTCSI